MAEAEEEGKQLSDVTPTQSCQFQLARLPARSNLQLASSPTSSRINLKIVVTSKVKPLSSDPVSDWRKVSELVAKKFAQLLRALVKFKRRRKVCFIPQTSNHDKFVCLKISESQESTGVHLNA